MAATCRDNFLVFTTISATNLADRMKTNTLSYLFDSCSKCQVVHKPFDALVIGTYKYYIKCNADISQKPS